MSTKKFQKSYFDVLGLCCSSEVPLIEKILRPLEGVQQVSVIVASRTVIVVHDNLVISQLQIVNALNQARLEANVRAYGQSNHGNKWPSPYAMACGIFFLLSLLKFVYHPLQWFAIVAVATGIIPILLKGYAALGNFTLDTNILALIAVMGSIALRDYLEAAAIVFLFTIAQWLESRASSKATVVMSSLINMVPQRAVLAETGKEIDVTEVMVNTILAVKPGENIPIDGVVVDGKCEVDEKTLTGESFPVFKDTDSVVWAGTINLNGYISVKTTALAEDCAVAKMAKLVEEAQNNKSKMHRLIDKCAKFYTPAIVAISIGMVAIPAILKVHNLSHWFHLALVVLVSCCPCSLILSTPVATFCGLSQAAVSGVLIKGGEYLETLSKIKIIGFDKTGTITRGEIVVTEFQSMVDGLSPKALLYWVSSIESKSSHPMAAALINYGRSLSVEPEPENVQEFENFPGEGIFGKIDRNDIYVGNRKIAVRAGCETVSSLDGIGEGKSVGYIFLRGALAGVFSLTDTCRSGAKQAINELKSMGIKTAMLTGDSNEAAVIAQNQLEGALEVINAELLPQDKADTIKKFQRQAPTAMVGDGLNDAPALATADIGISMGVSGSALSTETGHVILMSNDIRKIPLVIKLARKTQMKVIQNIVISISAKVVILGLAFGGYPLVWAAVLADVGTCLVVIFNSLLLMKGQEDQDRHGCKSSLKTCFRKRCKSNSTARGSLNCHSHNYNHKHAHSHEHESSSDVHEKSGSRLCHGHIDPSKEIKYRHKHASSTENGHKKSPTPTRPHGCCAHVEHLQDTKHSAVQDRRGSSDHHKHQFSKSCDDHAKNLSPNQTIGSCTHADHLKGTKHSSVRNSTRSDHMHKPHCSMRCDSHEMASSPSKKYGCCDDIAKYNSAKSVPKHKHHCSTHCDEKDLKPTKTKGCCKQKDQAKESEHTLDNKMGYNGEQKHFSSSISKSCEVKQCKNLAEIHEHRVEINEDHSDHPFSGDYCYSTCCVQKHEDHDCTGSNFGRNDCECANHRENLEVSTLPKSGKCGDTKACSSNLEKRQIGHCQIFSEECLCRNNGIGETVGGLSEIVVI